MILQRRFAPTGGRFESESVAGFTGICNDQVNVLKRLKIAPPPAFFDVRLRA
jgi:hypothetical protein